MIITTHTRPRDIHTLDQLHRRRNQDQNILLQLDLFLNLSNHTPHFTGQSVVLETILGVHTPLHIIQFIRTIRCLDLRLSHYLLHPMWILEHCLLQRVSSDHLRLLDMILLNSRQSIIWIPRDTMSLLITTILSSRPNEIPLETTTLSPNNSNP